jgi:hypothetical protein
MRATRGSLEPLPDQLALRGGVIVLFALFGVGRAARPYPQKRHQKNPLRTRGSITASAMSVRKFSGHDRGVIVRMMIAPGKLLVIRPRQRLQQQRSGLRQRSGSAATMGRSLKMRLRSKPRS